MHATLFNESLKMDCRITVAENENGPYFIISIENRNENFTIFTDTIESLESISKALNKFLINR